MLNVSQRLIFGCAVIAGITVTLAVVSHRAMVAAGQSSLGILLPFIAVLAAVGTVVAVLRPIRMLARDARRIAQGNLEHRAEWISRDSFGIIAAELNRLAVRLRDLRDTDAGRKQNGWQAKCKAWRC